MNAPETVVLTTGRSGSRSLHEFLNSIDIEASHEAHADPILMMSKFWVSGRIKNPGAVMAMLNELDWARVAIDFALAPLTPLLAQSWPNTQFMVLTRHPEDTIKSMARKAWYTRTETSSAPVYHHWYVETPTEVRSVTDLNYPGLRIQAPDTGIMDHLSWGQYTTIQRCAWWWNYSLNQAIGTFSSDDIGPGERCQIIRLEDAQRVIPPLFERPDVGFPWVNTSTASTATLHDRSWVPIVKNLADKLQYEVTE